MAETQADKQSKRNMIQPTYWHWIIVGRGQMKLTFIGLEPIILRMRLMRLLFYLLVPMTIHVTSNLYNKRMNPLRFHDRHFDVL